MKRLLILAAGLALAGCSDELQGPQCPSAAVLADTANLTVFRAGAPADPSGEAYSASISGVKTDCSFQKGAPDGHSSFRFTVRATRAPSPDGATYQLPYFFAVSQGERILSKKNATLTISFAPGSAAASADETLDETPIALEPGHPPTDYQLLVGFQLTEAERAYNQSRGRYTP